jgi:Protein of unknown function (DUF3788)
MTERPFLGKDQKPDAAALEVTLGPAFVFYRDLTGLCDAFKREWAHTKGSGWMLKVSDGKKALCFVIPLEDSFRVSMAIRESEHSALLESADMADYRDLLASARKFAEGYSVVFDVATDPAYEHCSRFVCRIIEVRG